MGYIYLNRKTTSMMNILLSVCMLYVCIILLKGIVEHKHDLLIVMEVSSVRNK